MLEKLETMEVVQLLGGMSIILGAVLTIFYKIFIVRIKSTWDKKTKKEIEELRKDLMRSNNTLSNLQNNYLSQIQVVNVKKLEAMEQLWKACLLVRESIPSSLYPVLSILPEEYVNMEYLNTPNPKGLEIGKEIRIIAPIIDINKPIEKLRPFIPMDLYALHKTHTSIVTGAVFNAITKFEKGNITHWKNEESIKKLLCETLTDREINHIYSLTYQSFQSLMELMELKIIECINKNITGEGTTVDSIEQLKRMESIISFNKETKKA